MELEVELERREEDGAAAAQWVELPDWWLEGRWLKSRLPWGGTELCV